ncbi:MAG: Co2+/Mg2+ efflux protein ApaG [Bdellovibrionota bacterium]
MSTSEAITRGVRVKVRARYSAEHSAPKENNFFFLYTVRISNEGTETVQLVSRHWIITDGTGSTREVKGPGVVGEQPVLAPGQSFEYTSGCPLSTPIGSMHGSYQMTTPEGDAFDAQIASFTLSEPYALN